MKLLAVPLGAIIIIDSNKPLGGTMSTFTVTYSVRRQMNELIDSLSYPSERKVKLLRAAQCESFIIIFDDDDYCGAAVKSRRCLALYQALANHGPNSEQFQAAYSVWVEAEALDAHTLVEFGQVGVPLSLLIAESTN